MTYIPTPSQIDYLPPLGSATTPPTGEITVPQSPSGTSVTNTGESESATQTFVSRLVPTVQQGTPALTQKPVISGVPNQNFNWYDGTESGVTP
jgi:hypothetical protein